MSGKDVDLTNLVNNNIEISTGIDFKNDQFGQNAERIIGRLEAFEINKSYNELMSLAQIHQVKLAYGRKEPSVLDYAPTFKDFCEKTGIVYNTVRKKMSYMSELGLRFLQQAEQLNLPMSSVKDVSRLPRAQRDKAIRAVLSDDATGEEVKELIRELVERDVNRQDLLNEASVTEKVELILENENLKSDLTSTKYYLSEEVDKNKTLRERNKELLESKKPEDQIRAARRISEQLELGLNLLSDVGQSDNPIFKAMKAEMQILAEGILEELK